MKDKPRIGSTAWIHARPNTAAIFNGAYDEDGTPLTIGNTEPWTLITPDGEWKHFWTHAEALEYVLKQEAGNQ